MLSIKDAKRRIMMSLAKSRNIFDLIANKEVDYECCDDLFYNNIFPFLKVDFTETQAGNYIGVGIDFPFIREKDTYKNAQITFLIICSTGTLRYGNSSYSRTDMIGEQVINLFQKSTMFGFPMYLISDVEDIHSSRFYYRKLIFQCKSHVEDECG